MDNNSPRRQNRQRNNNEEQIQSPPSRSVSSDLDSDLDYTWGDAPRSSEVSSVASLTPIPRMTMPTQQQPDNDFTNWRRRRVSNESVKSIAPPRGFRQQLEHSRNYPTMVNSQGVNTLTNQSATRPNRRGQHITRLRNFINRNNPQNR